MVALATSRALGTGVRVAVTDEDALAAAGEIVASWLERIDMACSRFRDDSDLQRINRADGAAVTVSALCLEAVRVALQMAESTAGLVDPTVGAAMLAIGYDRDFAAIGEPGAAAVLALPAPGWTSVSIDAQDCSVRIPEGTVLDLGASAKALAADRSAHDAAAQLGCGVLVSLGGDIAVAGPAPDGGWQVLVTDDHDAPLDAPGQTVGITTGGLATSSTTVRRWQRGGALLHHIVDPRTGMPADTPWRTASVTAASCVDANAATTAAIILGDEAPAWLEARRLPARLVDAGGNVRHVAGWPGAGERR